MKRRYWIPALVLAVLCLICLAVLIFYLRPPAAKPPMTSAPPSSQATASPSPKATAAPVRSEPPSVSALPLPEPTAEVSDEPYFSPIDFEALQADCPDIYAWLDIPGTEISYPVLQHPTDDTFYLDHDEFGKDSYNGCLFTEHVYNSKDFGDPVSIIYGHHKWYGAMFGELQNIYSDPEQFESLNEFIVYLPDREIRYEIFAAVPYDAVHILYHYDFSTPRIFRFFFADVLSIRAFGSNMLPDYALEPEDRVVILSTCFAGDNSRRYLVMGRELTE